MRSSHNAVFCMMYLIRVYFLHNEECLSFTGISRCSWEYLFIQNRIENRRILTAIDAVFTLALIHPHQFLYGFKTDQQITDRSRLRALLPALIQ